MATAQPLYFLVDFDNLRRFSTGKSLSAIANHLVNKLPDIFIDDAPQIDFRLYGGWRSGSNSTILAQKLATEIAQSFPMAVAKTLVNGKSINLRVNFRIAYSPLFLPSTPIEDTYIKGRGARRIYSEPRPWASCADQNACVLNPLESFLSKDICPNSQCSIRPKDVFRQDEQKQVDTMLVADLAHLTYKKIANRIVVVSSDADVWPGILLSLSESIEILQIQTSPGFQTPKSLAITLGALKKHYQSISV